MKIHQLNYQSTEGDKIKARFWDLAQKSQDKKEIDFVNKYIESTIFDQYVIVQSVDDSIEIDRLEKILERQIEIICKLKKQ